MAKVQIKKLAPVQQRGYAIIVAFAIIAFWRGLWGLLDMFLFPNDEFLSYMGSIIIGFGILLLTHKLTTISQ